LTKKTEWFVEPIGSASNRIIGRHLGEGAEEAILQGVLVTARDSRRAANLYRVSWKDVETFEASRKDNSELRFKIFNRASPGAQIIEKTALVRSWLKRRSPTATGRST